MQRSLVRPLTTALSAALAAGSGGGGSPSLPVDAIGVWFADAYVATPRRHIPNEASRFAEGDFAPSANLLRAPRRLFDSNNFWIKNGATVVDGNTSSQVTLNAGDSFLFAYPHPVLPAGTYTVAATVRRAGGSNQQFRFSFLHAGIDSPDFTATAGDQRRAFTATLPAGTNGVLLRTVAAGTAADLVISDLALYAGASDLGEPDFAGHIYLGANQFDTRPECSDGVLDLSAEGAHGLAQFPDDYSAFESMTVVAIAEKVHDDRDYSSIFCSVRGYQYFSPMMDNLRRASFGFGGTSNLLQDYALATQGGFNPLDAGYRAIAHRYDGDRATLFANDTRLIDRPIEVSEGADIRDLLVGAFSAVDLTGGYRFAAIAAWDRALTDEEVLQAQQALIARVAQSGVEVNTGGRYLIAVGDSLTVDSTTPSYAHLFAANADPIIYGAVYGQSGGTLTVLLTQAEVIDAAIPASGNGEHILSILIGTNDLTGSDDVAGFLANLSDFCDDRRAAGFKVVLGTIPPTDRPDFNTRRNAANAVIRTWTGVHVDAVADFAADPDMGPDGAESDLTLYSDGVHPTLLGQQKLEAVFRAAVNGLA